MSINMLKLANLDLIPAVKSVETNLGNFSYAA